MEDKDEAVIELGSPALQGRFFTVFAIREAQVKSCFLY